MTVREWLASLWSLRAVRADTFERRVERSEGVDYFEHPPGGPSKGRTYTLRLPRRCTLDEELIRMLNTSKVRVAGLSNNGDETVLIVTVA